MTPSTSDRPLFVVDASVAVKWHLTDEGDVAAAMAIRSDYIENRIALLAPEQIRYEAPSAILKAVRTRRLTADAGATAVGDFLAWRLPTVADDSMIANAFALSVRFGCSLYDGLYLALAESADCPFVHADNRLRNTLGGRFSLEVWVDDYVFLG